MYFKCMLVILFIAVSGLGRPAAGIGQSATHQPAGENAVAGAANRFGLTLFKEVVVHENPDANVFISPLSVSYALSMTLNGARGKTYDEVASTLSLTDISIDDVNTSFKNLTDLLTGLDSSVTFDIANSIWIQTGLPIRPDFVNSNTEFYNAVVGSLDFKVPSSADTINDWVSRNTHEKITHIATWPIGPNVVIYLINAIYFKGTWAREFREHATRDQAFFLADGAEVTCRMMHMTMTFPYFENDLYQAAALPYGQKDFAMLVFLPRPGISVDELIGKLDADTWLDWSNRLSHQEIELGLPRLKFEYGITLNDMLRAMGMKAAFSDTQADFSGMVELKNSPKEVAYITKVSHKTFLQVDEKGTEAAAATSVVLGIKDSAPMPKPVMILDRPFLFAIAEQNTGSIVFIGRVLKPEWRD